MKQFGLYEASSAVRSLRPLRPRQATVINDIRQAIREGHKRIVVQAPCGFGKTVVSAHLIQGSVNKGRRPMFTCPAITLVNQSLKSFEHEGIEDIGVIQAQHERTDFRAQVQVASMQTLIRRALPEVDMVIVDECHQQFAAFNKLLGSEDWKNKIIIGLSATPWARGMGLHWTKLIVAATIAELIAEGFLSPFTGVEPPPDFEVDMSEVKTRKNEFGEDDFDEESVAKEMNTPRLVANIVETWIKHRDMGDHTGDRTFLFAVNRAHAKSIRNKFEDAGINFGYIDGYSTEDERKETFRRYRSGEDKGIASVGCLVVGVDEDVRCIIDAAPTKSEIKLVQGDGRGLRTSPGKQVLFIIDHAGNRRRLGTVLDINHSELDCRQPGDKSESFLKDKPTKKPTKCKKCFGIIPFNARVCPRCGEKMVFTHNVKTINAELVRFGASSMAAKKESKPKKPEPTMAEKQDFYSGCLALAHDRGKKAGFAAHMYREKFGVWPNQLRDLPKPPSEEVQRFDRHRRIAYAKSMEKSAATNKVGATA